MHTDDNLLIGTGLMQRFGFRVPVEDSAFRTATAFLYIRELLELQGVNAMAFTAVSRKNIHGSAVRCR